MSFSPSTQAKVRLRSIYLPVIKPFLNVTTQTIHRVGLHRFHLLKQSLRKVIFLKISPAGLNAYFTLIVSLNWNYLGLILRSGQACTQVWHHRFHWDYFCCISAQVAAQTGPLSVLSLPGFPSYWWVSTESQLSLILPGYGSVSKTQNSKVCCTAKQETQIKEFQTAVYHKPVKTMYIVQIVIGETNQVTEPI